MNNGFTTACQLVGIMAKELMLIIISYAVWGPTLTKKDLNISTIMRPWLLLLHNKGTTKNTFIMHLRTSLFLVSHGYIGY